MDSFREPLQHHLHGEIDAMSALATHPHYLGQQHRDVLPFFLLNTDRTFEGGLWKKWSEMPEPIRWAMINLVGMWHEFALEVYEL
ncbi:hypothetical protein E4U53_001745 [Claviceps sorghi]|nr:hypothetical protein E4U53_001745 [Claviceps sorghi]